MKEKVDFDAVKEVVKLKKIELLGAGPNKAPECYKKLREVLKNHEGPIRILQKLTPVEVSMACEETFDPYKS